MNDPWAEIKALRYPRDERGTMEKINDWGNTNPTKRAVAGFIPAVGQALDFMEIADPNSDMRTRAGHVASAMPWGKVGRILKALRGAKPAERVINKETVDQVHRELRKESKALRKKRVIDIENEVAKDTLRDLRKAAVPTGAGILGTAAAAKYLDDDEE